MKGSTVTAGQLLISGIADIDERGVYFTRGEGKIFARTWYDLRADVPKTAVEKSYTGRERKIFTLILGKQRVKISLNSSISYTEYDKIKTVKKLRLPGGAALPVALECLTAREYTPAEHAVTREEAQMQGEAALRLRLRDAMEADGTVLDSSVTVEEREGAYRVTLHAECEEQIGKTVPIP
jgi:similar to stage IV sporulation protein